GQPAAYVVRQLEDFAAGRRISADPRKPNTVTMAKLAAAMSSAEMKEAADYFAACAWVAWVRVVEADVVPKTKITNNLFIPVDGTEPIAGRIVEVPEDEDQSGLLRNPRSGFVAYVPKGSVERGRNLAERG